MKILLFSSLYPDKNNPRHGIFVEQRLQQLLRYSNVIEVTVVAPSPIRPTINKILFNRAIFSSKQDTYNAINIYRPKFISIPFLGKYINPIIIFLASYYTIKKLLSESSFDLIDAHYFYPDGVAAAFIGKAFNLPVVITARGTDINVFPKYFIPRKYIQWAAKYASAIITVSEALRQKLIELKVPEYKITTLINGVDLNLFKMNSSLTKPDAITNINKYILMVGNLVNEKRQDLAIRSLKHLEDISLVLVGDGPNKKKLEQLCHELGVYSRVKFIGNISQKELISYYSNASLLLLLSEREGMPNVVLEALACGLYVIATNVGGVPEILTENEVGTILDDNSISSITKAVDFHLNIKHSKEYIRTFSQSLGWEHTNKSQLKIFSTISRGNNGFRS